MGMMMYDVTSSRRMQMLDPSGEKADADLELGVSSPSEQANDELLKLTSD